MRLRELYQDDLDEGWKDWVAGAALGLSALGANADVVKAEPGDTIYSIARANNVDPKLIMKLNNFDNKTRLDVGQKIKVPGTKKQTTKEPVTKKKEDPLKTISKQEIEKTVTGNPHEVFLKKAALKAGLKGHELAAFLAQCAHETLNFKFMKEIGGSLDFRKYDPKYAPKKAKALGNKKVGDGAKYKGRGYIQITGRYNYKKAGEALGLPLEEKPELVEKPAIAAKVALWYWNNRVKPNVDSFKDVKDVTGEINPGLKHLDQRKDKFNAFKVAML